MQTLIYSILALVPMQFLLFVWRFATLTARVGVLEKSDDKLQTEVDGINQLNVRMAVLETQSKQTNETLTDIKELITRALISRWQENNTVKELERVK